MFNPLTVQGCKDHGVCCSSLQEADFPDDFDYGDITGETRLHSFCRGGATPAVHQCHLILLCATRLHGLLKTSQRSLSPVRNCLWDCPSPDQEIILQTQACRSKS